MLHFLLVVQGNNLELLSVFVVISVFYLSVHILLIEQPYCAYKDVYYILNTKLSL